MLSRIVPAPARQEFTLPGPGDARRVSISAYPGGSGYHRGRVGREDWPVMSTRTLLILAAITGVAILTAGAVQILLAR